MTTRSPVFSGCARSEAVEHVTDTDASACVSRNVRYDSFHVGFELICAISPSTQIWPSCSIQSFTI